MVTGVHPIRGREVLVTGGLGFIGSNLSIRLVGLGASVTIVDALVNGCGGSLYNIAPIADRVRLIRRDVAEAQHFREAIHRSEIIFNLAGEIRHIHSMRFPARDGRLNASAQLEFLEECARSAPGSRVVYAGTRQIFGAPRYLPVDENHPIAPVDFNGVHKYAAMMYHLLYARTGSLDAAVLNLTNVYGPRMALSIQGQGFLGNFVRKLSTGLRLEVFGDGKQLRDPLYVEDAVDAFLAAGTASHLPSRVYNLGGPEPLEIRRIAQLATQLAGAEAPSFRSFPPEQKLIDIGSYHANRSRIRTELGWEPKVHLEDGLRRTLSFYSTELPHYLDPPAGPPPSGADSAHMAKAAS